MSVPIPRRRRVEWAILLGSFALFLAYLWQNTSLPIYFDQRQYFLLGEELAQNGLYTTSTRFATRTYLYPALIAFCGFFTSSLSATRVVVALLQYGVLVATVFRLARTPGTAFQASFARTAVLAAGLLNPYLVQATTLLVTDALAACCVALAIAGVWRADLSRFRGVALTTGLCLVATMLRPAALPFAIIVVALAGLRFVLRRDFSPKAFAWRSACWLLVFVPQLVINVRTFGAYTPLFAKNQYALQQAWGLERLRWVTSVVPGIGGIIYENPIEVAPGATIGSLLIDNPLALVVAYGAHLFHILDWGYVDIFVDDLYAISRIFGSVFVYFAWFLVALGGVAIIRLRSRPEVDAQGFAVLGVGAAAYSAFLLTTQIETRYIYPVYLVALPFVAPGFASVVSWLRSDSGRFGGRPGARAALLLGVAAGVSTVLLLCSLALDRTTREIDWFAHWLG